MNRAASPTMPTHTQRRLQRRMRRRLRDQWTRGRALLALLEAPSRVPAVYQRATVAPTAGAYAA